VSDVLEIENLWIPMSDGCRLAARAWLPADAERSPVPAVLEYLPYRKRDGTRSRDESMHRWLAARGFACLRVDLRGTGDSDGLLADEYHERELADGVEAIRWIAGRPWCSGRVGMIGKSWGGFNALQIAALAPPELGAVISVCSTDDRYADDAHYMGGCLLNENLVWGSVLLTIDAQPPDPLIVGPSWRERWLERLEAAPLFPEIWMRHPRRDAYWRHGSVCEDYSAIRCPVWVVGGWADAYTNAVPRLLAHLDVPRRGLVGPWAHRYPHDGLPGPAIGFLQEARRFFERWLAGRGEGLEGEPLYRAWMPAPSDESGGRWIGEQSWPAPRIRPRLLHFAAGALVASPPREGAALVIRSPQDTGLCAGSWCSYGEIELAATEQGPDDERSLVLDSEPLDAPLEILGAPRLHLAIRADRPLALLAARLEEVTAAGRSRRVTYGLLNLCHRDGHEHPEPLEPGRRYAVSLALNDVAHCFARGARIRLALSSAYWPIAWPSPEAVELTVHTDSSRLELPVRPPRPEDEALRAFEPPAMSAPDCACDLDSSGVVRRLRGRSESGANVIRVLHDMDEAGRPVLTHFGSIDLTQGHGMVETYSIHPDDPLSARAELEHRTESRRGDWRARVESAVRLTAERGEFRLRARLEAWEGDERVFSRSWDRRLPRDHV